MNIGVQIEHIGMRRGVAQLWHEACVALMRLYKAVAGELLHGHAMRLSDGLRDTQPQAVIDDSQILRRAVHINSSDEIDWLLYAAVLTDPAKRRYCLERALALNPDSDIAKQAIVDIPVLRYVEETLSSAEESTERCNITINGRNKTTGII
jgi:hypothetical protein